MDLLIPASPFVCDNQSNFFTLQTFIGNTDHANIVQNHLPQPVHTKKIRFIPTLSVSHVSARVDIMGC